MKQLGLKAETRDGASRLSRDLQVHRDPILVLAEELGKLIDKQAASAEIRQKDGRDSEPTALRNA